MVKHMEVSLLNISSIFTSRSICSKKVADKRLSDKKGSDNSTPRDKNAHNQHLEVSQHSVALDLVYAK